MKRKKWLWCLIIGLLAALVIGLLVALVLTGHSKHGKTAGTASDPTASASEYDARQGESGDTAASRTDADGAPAGVSGATDGSVDLDGSSGGSGSNSGSGSSSGNASGSGSSSGSGTSHVDDGSVDIPSGNGSGSNSGSGGNSGSGNSSGNGSGSGTPTVVDPDLDNQSNWIYGDL